MRIESLHIRNMRQMKDLSLRFGKVNGDNDLHIILAENGVGKTNIVNAITWCLYNREMHLRDEETALPILNNQVIEELRQIGGGTSKVSVELVIFTDEQQGKITFTREGSFNVTDDACIPLSDKLTVSMIGEGGFQIIENDEETSQLIHKYLPEEISNYIFFDGEQLEKFFSQNQLENVRKGINELTQASYMKKAYDFLDAYIKSTLEPKIASMGSKEIATQQEKVNKINEQIVLASQTIKTYGEQIATCDDEISRLTNKIKGCESLREKTEEFETLENDIEESRAKEDLKTQELMKFTREYYTIFGLYPSLKAFYDYIRTQDQKGNLPPRIDKKILAKILTSRHCSICDSENLDDHSLEYVKELEKSLAVASATSSELNRSFGNINSFFDKLKSFNDQKEMLIRDLATIRDEIKKRVDRYEKLHKYLQSVPDNEEITSALDQRDEFSKKRDDLIGKKATEESNKKELEKRYLEEDKKLQELISKQKDLEAIERQKEFCQNCSKVLKSCKDEILEECRLQIQTKTFEIFNRLIWKKDAFSKVEILENYAFRLLDTYGTQSLGSCSAAETALLALSFTLSLQDVSKHDSLLFIDTPIGRVGVENRSNFMNTLLTIAKNKQVILTFTPTEYDDNIKRILSNNYNTFHTLVMHNNVTNTK